MCFFFISLTFPCIYAKEPTTAWLACCQTGDASPAVEHQPFSWVLVCVCWSMCVWEKKCVWGGIVRTWPAHFACSPRDRCSWASTGAWQLPFIAVFSTLNPWPALPPSSFSSSSSPPLSSHPLSSTSDLFSRRFPRPSWVMDCERLVGGLRFLYVVVWCGRLVTILTLSGHGNPAVQNEQHTHTHTHSHSRTHTYTTFCSTVRNSIHRRCQALDQTCIKKRAPWLNPIFSLPIIM